MFAFLCYKAKIVILIKLSLLPSEFNELFSSEVGENILYFDKLLYFSVDSDLYALLNIPT